MRLQITTILGIFFRLLLPFDQLVTVVSFFGRNDLMNIAPVARRLNSASYFNSVISGERFVPDLTIRRDRYGSWIATDRWRCNTFPLPVTKPPPQILGFGDIKIEMCEERGILEVSFATINYSLSYNLAFYMLYQICPLRF